MYILLINSDPTVSRLMMLCTREEELILEEVSDIESLVRTHYDIVFVDDASYPAKIGEFPTTKKVLFSNQKNDLNEFDLIIEKPFLPSKIIEYIADVKDEVLHSNDITTSEDSVDGHFIFPLSTEDMAEDNDTNILDIVEIERIKNLLDVNDNVDDIELTDEEREAKKIEVIKEHLISDGLEIVEESEIVESLSSQESLPMNVETNSSQENKKKKKALEFTEEERSLIEDAIEVAIGSLKRKKMKKLLKGKKVKIKIKANM